MPECDASESEVKTLKTTDPIDSGASISFNPFSFGILKDLESRDKR